MGIQGSLPTALAIALLAASPLKADNLLTASGNCASRGALNSNYVFGTYWSQNISYSNVAISIAATTSPSTDGTPISAFLTRNIGPGTTSADEVAHTTFTIPSGTAANTLVPVFGGLTLPSGDYFLSLYAPTYGNAGGWCLATNTPGLTSGTGVIFQYTYLLNGGGAYPPAGGNLNYWGNAQFSITGTPPGPPVIISSGIVPIYSATSTIAPGSWVSIFGNNFSTSTSIWSGDFPTELGGVSVTINGKPAYLWAVTPTQINLQVADDMTTGAVPVVVRNAYGAASSMATLSPIAPSLLLFDATYPAAVIQTPDGSGAYGGGTYDLLGPPGHFSFNTRAAKEGQVVELYATGFGPTIPTVPSGHAYSGAASVTAPVRISIGGTAQTAPCYLVGAGLTQCNITVPAVGSGDHPLQATVGSVNTQNNISMTVLAAGQNPAPVLSSVSPASVPVGMSVTIALAGTSFLPASVVTFNGKPHPVTFISSSSLTMILSPVDIPAAGSYPIVVTNPAPGGGATKAVNLIVSTPTLSLGANGFTITGPLSIMGTTVTLEIQAIPGGNSYFIELDDNLSPSSSVQLVAGFNSPATLSQTTASFSGPAVTGIYENTSNVFSPVIANINSVALTVTFSSVSPSSGSSVNGTISLNTSAGIIQGVFTGKLS